MAHPKRFELLTPRFVVWCSIQLSYGCAGPERPAFAGSPVRLPMANPHGKAGRTGNGNDSEKQAWIRQNSHLPLRGAAFRFGPDSTGGNTANRRAGRFGLTAIHRQLCKHPAQANLPVGRCNGGLNAACRKIDAEDRSARPRLLQFDRAAMAAHKFGGNGQAKPGTA